jgi:TP901 family phage tail tape measure protein
LAERRIQIIVDATSAGVGRGLSAGLSALQGFERQASSTFAGLSGGTKILAGVGLGIGLLATGMAAVIGPAIKFESAFAGVRKTVDGTPAQLAGIRDGILDMSRVMPTAASELADIAANAGQLGVKAPDVLAFTKTIAQLGETTDLSFDDAAQSLARFLNITGDGASAIGGVADVIVELGNNSATTESQIVDFATRLASSFTVAGASEDQILALASSFSSLGLQAEAGGSALSTIITSISDAAKLGGKELNTYASVAGLLPEQFAAIAKANPVEALLLFGEGLGEVAARGESITPILQDIELGGLRTSEVFRLLALNSGFVREQLGLAADALATGGAAQEEFDKRVETTASRLEILKNRIEVLRIEAGTPLLGGLVVAIDLAGDAIERLVEILKPLGAEIGATFGNAGQLVAAFFDVLSGPGASAGAGALGSLVDVVVDLLAAFNSLGPAGLVIAALIADIALVGPVSIAAASALSAIAVAGGGMAGALAAAQAGLGGLLASINPIAAAGALAVVAFVVLGRETRELEAAAKAAGAALSGDLEAAFAAGSATDYAAVIRSAADEINRLELAVSGGGEGGVTGAVNQFNQFMDRMLGGLGGVSDELAPARAELEAFQGALSTDEVENFDRNIALIADHLGLTRGAVIAAVDATGQFNNVTANGTAGLIEARTAVAGYTASITGMDNVTRETMNAVLDGTATVDQFAAALGITAEQLGFVASKLDGVDFEDFFSDDPEAKMLALAKAEEFLITQIDGVSAALGQSRTEFLASLAAVDALAASHNALRSAVQNAKDAIAVMGEQQRITQAATEAFKEASTNVVDAESFRVAASAMRELTFEFAASGVSAEAAVAKQVQLRNTLTEIGLAAGLSAKEVAAIIVELGLVPPETIALLTVDGEAAKAEADARQAQLEALEREYQARLTAIDEGSSVIEAVRSIADDWERRYTAEAIMADLGASETINRLDAAATDWERKYNASLTASDDGASATTARLDAGATDWERKYNASLTASDDGASGQISGRQGQADSYEGSYNANLTATDNASGTIAKAVGALSGFKSKTITLTTVTSTVPGNVRADGGISFAAGAILQRPGPAHIYSAVSPARYFAEPVTGGEAYIPLAAGKRARSLAIWEETGRLLGAFAGGGIAAYQAGVITTARAPITPFTVDGRRGINIENVTVAPGRDLWQELALVDTMARAGAL